MTECAFSEYAEWSTAEYALNSRKRVRLIKTMWLLGVALLGCNRPSPPQSAAHLRLYEALGRPVALRADGDSGFVVIKMDRQRAKPSDAQQLIMAQAVARAVANGWPDPRLTHVTVVIQRPSRLGPLMLRGSEDTIRIDLRTLH